MLVYIPFGMEPQATIKALLIEDLQFFCESFFIARPKQ